jgi:hypothetical protein
MPPHDGDGRRGGSDHQDDTDDDGWSHDDLHGGRPGPSPTMTKSDGPGLKTSGGDTSLPTRTGAYNTMVTTGDDTPWEHSHTDEQSLGSQELWLTAETVTPKAPMGSTSGGRASTTSREGRSNGV